MSLIDFREQVRSNVRDQLDQDNRILSDEDLNRWINDAVDIYSQYRELETTVDISLSASQSVVDLPADFEDGLSRAVSVELPANQTPPTILEKHRWALRRRAAGLKLMLFYDAPAAPATLALSYTRKHTVAVTTTTVPASDHRAVTDWASALALRAMASHFTQTSDPTREADIVNYRQRSEECIRLAESREELFFKHMGLTSPARRDRESVTFESLATDRRTDPEIRRSNP